MLLMWKSDLIFGDIISPVLQSPVLKIILIEMAFESQFTHSTKEAIPFWCPPSTWIMEMVHLERPFNGMFLASNKMSPPYQSPL